MSLPLPLPRSGLLQNKLYLETAFQEQPLCEHLPVSYTHLTLPTIYSV